MSTTYCMKNKKDQKRILLQKDSPRIHFGKSNYKLRCTVKNANILFYTVSKCLFDGEVKNQNNIH